jgi:hypothetical protein
MPADGESRYRCAPSPEPQNAALTVRVEFAVMDGPAGQALGHRQADVMQEVLRWIARYRDRGNQ